MKLRITKKTFFLILKVFLLCICVYAFIKIFITYQNHADDRAQLAAQDKSIEQLIESHSGISNFGKGTK